MHRPRRTRQTGIVTEPFLKWPGGKRWVAGALAMVLRQHLSGTYYEPFVGAGAVFLRLRPERAVLSDSNAELIACLQTTAESPEAVVERVWRWSNRRDCYYRVRSMRPRTRVSAAARLIYLTGTCWGGIYRVNKRGQFNVPFGSSGRQVCNRMAVLRAAEQFASATLTCSDFAPIVSKATGGDVVYVDPPYTTRGENNGFVRYNERLFSWRDQERLAVSCRGAARRGAFVAVSGLRHRSMLGLYPGWHVMELRRPSTVSRRREGRRVVREVILFSEDPCAVPAQLWGS